MNSIHKILAINNKELDQSVPDNASWHADYSDTSYIYIGNLHESLKEKDILTIFSQYGNPTHINLVKDKESGKSRGFCYLKYEDQRSCVLAIDNFNGSLVYERPLKVDHTYFKLVGSQTEDDFKVEYPEIQPPKQIEHRKSEPKKIEPKMLDAPVFDDDDFNDPMAMMETSHSNEHKSHRSHRDKESHRSHRHKESHRSHRSHRDDRDSRREGKSRSHRRENEDPEKRERRSEKRYRDEEESRDKRHKHDRHKQDDHEKN